MPSNSGAVHRVEENSLKNNFVRADTVIHAVGLFHAGFPTRLLYSITSQEDERKMRQKVHSHTQEATAVGSAHEQAVIPPAGLCDGSEGLDAVADGEDPGVTPAERTEGPCRSTSAYAGPTFDVLHQVLRAVQSGACGARIDPLVRALRGLSRLCDDRATRLSRAPLKPGSRSGAGSQWAADAQAARGVADAVHLVLVFLEGRALDGEALWELNDSWQRLRRALVAPPVPASRATP
jgi:hypothetical protein